MFSAFYQPFPWGCVNARRLAQIHKLVFVISFIFDGDHRRFHPSNYRRVESMEFFVCLFSSARADVDKGSESQFFNLVDRCERRARARERTDVCLICISHCPLRRTALIKSRANVDVGLECSQCRGKQRGNQSLTIDATIRSATANETKR